MKKLHIQNIKEMIRFPVSFKLVNSSCIALWFVFVSCKPDPAPVTRTSQKSVKTTDSLCWKDFRYGELPPVGAYDAIDSLVKKWNLCYERIEAGCVITDSIKNLKKQYQASNKLYFESLEKKLGKNWKQDFDKELHTLDSINWISIKRKMDALNRSETQ
ncbi:hypothetical protein [Chryseobacterium arthrosphaerae]|uniref:FEKKY domain-containing protein n=1 Tax=Chryseobacterium arthrosphaerae TaxID=651561 RepID=UPI001E4E07A5|nr:hypothetical protein [Chryseobacterium arthrosphaerae]UEQ77436.1 hypothetical protein J8N07_03780 [Chryseobacterium arthrosphaerae]